MTDLEKLKARVQETEFPVGAKIKEGDIEVEVQKYSFQNNSCKNCKIKPICDYDVPMCVNKNREDRISVIFKQTNGN